MGLFNFFNGQNDESESRFDNDAVMPKFEVPEGINVLDYKTLPDYEIEEIILPSTLREIDTDGDVFERRKLLRYVDFSKVTMLKEIPDCCFQDCKSLESIIIPEGVVTLGDYAFDGCNNLRQIILPASLERVSTLNSSQISDVYLLSGQLNECWFDELSCNVNNLFVAPQFLARYQEMKREMELEVNLNVIPDEFFAPKSSPQPPVYAGDISFMVSVNGQSAGPYTIPELQQFVATGEFTPHVYVWREGMPQWELAANVPELANLF